MAAIALTVEQVKGATDVNLHDQDATRLGSMAAALVEKYAPDAPDGVKLEAAIRCIGWWTQSPIMPISSRSFGNAGVVGSVDYALHKLNPILHSGAAMILTPWRIHTMGVV